VIYSRDTIVAFWFVLWGARVIYEVHDLESEHPSKIASPRVRRWMARVDGKTLRGARGVVSLTETFKNALVRWGWQPEARVWVIPDAFDETTFYPRPRDECRAALGIPRDALVVAYAGMTFAYRGLETLLEAFRLWSEPRARLYLIGGRPFEIDALKAEAHAWGLGDAVVFTGKLPGEKTAQYLNAADILVIPGTVTTATASPLKMFEYMALARPIVAVDLPALREILHDDAALFFSTGMARELQACLVHLAADPARAAALAARARERVAPFTYARRAEKILEAIRTVMSF
jgi:glycosyltransferase involved in cell wall biosynthesis